MTGTHPALETTYRPNGKSTGRTPVKPRTIAAITAAAVLTLAACGDPGSDIDDSRPVAYGEAGACYYVDDPAEVVALQQAGYCPVNWAPAPMPAAWRSQYAWYYDSPSYYDRYVPSSRRTVYVKQVKYYEQTNPRAVRVAPSRPAVRVGSGSSKFNSGSGRRGGDSASSRQSAPRPSAVKVGGGSGSFKSGSRR